jgi:hypothetical protein
MTTTRTWRPQLDPRLRMEVIEGEAVLLDRTHERVHHLNEVGTFILRCCTGHKTEDEIVAAVVERFDVDGTIAEVDATDLIAQMRDLDILI